MIIKEPLATGTGAASRVILFHGTARPCHRSISIVADGRRDVCDGAHGAFVMKDVEVSCAVNLHNAVTVSQQRLGKRVAQLSSARMNEVCAALRFSLGCDSN